jgi:hypothetical protein
MRTTFRLFGLLALAFAVTLLAAPATDAAISCPSVSVSGPSNVYAETSCVSPVWSAVCSCKGGLSPSYSWYIGGVFAGNGSSASRTFCPTTPAQTSTITVQAIITCGQFGYFPSKSVFVSQCDNTTSPPTCNG